MKNKIFKVLGLAFLCIVGAIGFAGCNNQAGKDKDGGNNISTPEPQNTVTVSFISRYGNLSFNSKTYELENGYVFIDSADFPTVTDEGEARVFDKWLYENNIEFSADNPVTKDITLHTSFVESEFVWTENWVEHDNYYSLYMDTKFNISGECNNEYRNDRYPALVLLQGTNPTFTKIKKSDCLDSYITKSEFNNLTGYCFTTSSNGEEKFVTENDFTLDTYQYYVDIIIGNQNFGYCAAGYLPKGVNLYQNYMLSKQFSFLADPKNGSAVNRLLKKFVIDNAPKSSGQGSFESGIDLDSSKHYIIANSEDCAKYDLESIRQACNNEDYTCDYDFNESVYIAYICADYMYCYDYDSKNDVESFSFVATDWKTTDCVATVYKINCTKEEFDEFREKYLSNFTYKKN